MLPDRTFKAQALALNDWPEAPFITGGGIIGVNDEDADVLARDGDQFFYGTLIAYMMRRFGPPNKPSDPYKTIADWFITTPIDGLSLLVSPNVSGPRYSFGSMIATSRAHELIREERRTQAARYNQALGKAVRDLLRPVAVRDAYINASGQVGDDDRLIGIYDEDTEETTDSFVVEHSPSAGRFLPPETIEQVVRQLQAKDDG